MFIRKKKNKSGIVSIQIIDTSGLTDRLVKTIGSSSDEIELKKLYFQAEKWIDKYTGQQEMGFLSSEDSAFLNRLSGSLQKILMVGPELLLGKIYNEIGYNQIESDILRHLVVSRLVFPLSKLKTSEYLRRYQNIDLSIDKIYRFLDKIDEELAFRLQQISYKHTLSLFDTNISVVFYDVTTLYFEASDEDDLRKTGFSKEGKHQHPQIVLGLLVSQFGYPLAFDMFEGNQFEGHTMMPILEAFKKKFHLEKLVVIADSGLMSKSNIETLNQKGYEFMIGARLKNESNEVKKQIMSLKLEEGKPLSLSHPNGHKLIVTYSSRRAKKDEDNRKKGIAKLEKKLASGKLTKQHINNRGYNKYLKLKGSVSVSIDYDKFEQDKRWDGLKGYLTNSQMEENNLLAQYNELWQIEKAFRISKTDLRVRPIYHRLPHRIKAHLAIAFCSYKLYKELERRLIELNIKQSPEKIIDEIKTIYSIKVQLPSSRKSKDILFYETELQKDIIEKFNLNI